MSTNGYMKPEIVVYDTPGKITITLENVAFGGLSTTTTDDASHLQGEARTMLIRHMTGVLMDRLCALREQLMAMPLGGETTLN